MLAYLPAIGILLIFAGFALLVIYALLSSAGPSTGQKSALNVGGVVMIGPIPIVFGSSPSMAIAAMAIALALIILAIVFFFLLRR